MARAESPSRALESLAGSALPDLPSWWSEAGAPGWMAGRWLGVSQPWVIAGHAVAAWSLVEPGRAPKASPSPGVGGIETPLVWYDSVEVRLLEDGAWRGFGASLATAIGHGRVGADRGASAIVDLRSGDSGYDENSLSIERGDSISWIRGEAVSGSRLAVSGLEQMGRHLWGASAGIARGHHNVEGAFAQRASSATLTSGDEEASRGESGAMTYGFRHQDFGANLRAERGHDLHESLGTLIPSRRAADETALSAEGRRRSRAGEWSARAEWRRAHVVREEPAESPVPGFDRRASSVWGAARYDRPFGDGVARVELGAGRHSVIDRIDVAPAISYRLRARALDARFGFERVLAPLWSDLAPGTGPALQRTWAGVIEVATEARRRERARATFLFGRTWDRALLRRLPLDEEWLRLGVATDPGRYDFALLVLKGSIETRRLAWGADGFALGRSGDSEPRVDPATGARGWLAVRRTFFQGDLGAVLRADLEWIGARESQGGIPELCGDLAILPSRELEGYVTAGAGALVTIADALVTLRVRNLENRRRTEPWVDCAQFTEALGPGREWRMAVTVKLSN